MSITRNPGCILVPQYLFNAMNSLTTDVDVVFIKGITFEAVVGPDAWHRPNKAQPVVVNVRLSPATGLHTAAQEDDVSYTINYGTLYKSLMLSLANQIFESVQTLYQTIRSQLPATKSWTITVKLPKAILLAEDGVTFEWTSVSGDDGVQLIVQSMQIANIVSRCIIGVNSHERMEKQQLKISVLIKGLENRLSPSMLAGVKVDAISVPVYQSLTKDIFEVCAHLDKCAP